MFLKKEFGISSKVGWMLDAFGHSSANAALFADFGFDAVFFTRMSYQVREELMRTESSAFLWRPFPKHFGAQKQILALTTVKDYSFPDGFKVDERYDDDQPVITNKEL